MSMNYEDARLDKHKTLGDAAQRYNRDKDAFTAGAQYALDVLLGRIEQTLAAFDPAIPKFIDSSAAEILSGLHEGRFV